MKRKVAVVTGSAKGIGKELIKEFAKQNYDVIITYNTSEKEAFELKKYVELENDVNAMIIKCDITNEEEIRNMRDVISNKYKNIDILINNAAYASDNYLVDKSKKEFMKVLEVNVVGTFLVTKYLHQYLNNGIIVNISSTDAVDTYSKISMDYCASKAGINSLTKTFAQEFENIKVIGVMPRWVSTESVIEMNPEYLKGELERLGQDKLESPEDVAKDIIKLINDENVESGEIFYECKRNNKKC